MNGRLGYSTQLISILLILCLLLAFLPAPFKAQETKEVQAKRVMFRDDDVVSFSDALRAVNKVHIDEGVPVTLGVVPAVSFPIQNVTDFYLWNLPFAQYMRALVANNLFELAQHGYNHSNNSVLYGVPLASEFQGMPYDEQYRLIAEGSSLMQSTLGTAPTTFIPPYNTGDDNTLIALSKLGFTVYSSCTEDEVHNSLNLTLEPQQLGLNVDKVQNSTFELLVNQTESLLNDQRVHDIVVVYHNDRFTLNNGNHTVDPRKVDLLRHYIEYLKTKNVTFSTLNGKSPNLGLMSSFSNVTQTSSEPIMLERARVQWIYFMLAVAAIGGVGIFIKHKK